MSASREAYSRYRLIDERLKIKPEPTLEDLVHYCSEAIGKDISKRTLQNDLYNLRYDQGLKFEAPIVFNRSTRTYCYRDPAYSITNLPVSAEELQGLDFAISILEQFRHLTPIREFEEAILKIADTVKWNKTRRNLSSYIRLDKPFPVKGTEWLETLLQAIGKQEKIRFQYTRYHTNQEKTHLIEPVLIREYRNFWYILGVSREKGEARLLTFALDRMSELELTGEYFVAEPTEREELYKDVIGVTLGTGQAEEILLSFSPLQGKYILTNPLHTSQQVVLENEKELQIRLWLQPNFELRSTLLSFGSSVKVLQPAHLAESILEETKKMLARYQ